MLDLHPNFMLGSLGSLFSLTPTASQVETRRVQIKWLEGLTRDIYPSHLLAVCQAEI